MSDAPTRYTSHVYNICRPICELDTPAILVLLDANIVQTICSRMLEAES